MDQDNNEEAGSKLKPISEFAIPKDKDAQVDTAARLQGLWLRQMEYMLENGSISSTDMATLARVLLHNGWSLDPAKLPRNLRDKLTKAVGPLEGIDEEAYGRPRMVK